jgi:DNA-binding response OmpR family regulator
VDSICLEVRDTGIGIPDLLQTAVFERFDRGAQEGKHIPGTGIGLSLVKELTEACDGRIELRSSPDLGTSVIVLLPEAGRPDSVEATAAPGAATRQEIDYLELAPSVDEETPEAQEGPIVLIVEDSDELRNYLPTVLGSSYSCVLAPDGEAGLDAARESVPDLVVCDAMLPGISGFEVCKELKGDPTTSHIPLLMLTARADDASRVKGYEHHVDDYLTKPFSNEELRLRIGNLLDAREAMRKRYARFLFLDSGEEVELADRDKTFIDKLEWAVGSRYEDSEFTPSDLASMMAMSLRQLQRKTKAVTDHNPGEYLRNFRLAKARALIEAGEPVGRVALDVGFTSQSYFARCFKALYGMLPSELREKH